MIVIGIFELIMIIIIIVSVLLILSKIPKLPDWNGYYSDTTTYHDDLYRNW
jgi:hypothetical protein